MSLPQFSVKNRLLVNLLSLFVLLAGIFTFLTMRREAFPTFSFDIVTVTTTYPGATPEQVEKLITRPIEDELRALSDIDEISSISAEGYSLVIVKLDPDVSNKEKVVTEIGQAVDRVDDFPSNLEKLPITREIRTQDAPIIEIALSGDLSRRQLQKVARDLETELEEIYGVSSIARNGWRDEQIWVEMDANKLRTLQVSSGEVVRAIQSRNINVPGGKIDTGEKEFLIRTNAEFQEPQEINLIPIRANEVGKVILVGDVAQAKWAFDEASTEGRVDGTSAVSLVVIKKEKADVIDLVAEIERVVSDFQLRAPKELRVAYVNDISFYVKQRLGILLNNGWIGLIFVLISLFLFLSRPVAFWTVVGLPIAAGLGLWFMTLFDVSINLMSMFGMIMVLGMVVDDAIIVAENIYRKIEEGVPPLRAAVEGAEEVTLPVTVAVLTTIVVFLPLAFMTGIFGKFVWTIPVVVIIMLAASLIESLVILPSHLTEFQNRPKKTKEKKEGPFLRFRRFYGEALRTLLHRPVFATFASLGIVFGGIALGLKVIPLNLFPGKGIEIFFIRAEGEMGTPLEKTLERLKEVEKVIAKLPSDELKNYVTIAGIVQNDPNDPFTVRGSHVGQIVVYLTPEGKRGRTAYEVMDAIRPELNSITGFKRIWLDEVKPGPPVGRPVSVQVRGEDFSVLEELANRVKKVLQGIDGVKDIRDDYEEGKDEVMISIDKERAARAGLTPENIGLTLRTAFEGALATIIREGEEETDVVVRLDEKSRKSIDTIERLYFENVRGYHVPFRQVAKLERGVGISSIRHLDGKRVISVTAAVDEETTTSYAVNEIVRSKMSEISQGKVGYTFTLGGEAKDTQESLDSLKRAFILAIFFVFILLAATFRSILQPFLIMLAIPFGLFSALLSLFFHGEPLSFLALLGMIGLAGVSVNDSIVLVDFINQRRRAGDNLIDSVVDACQTRLRPVLLTSITTIVGLAPVAYGIGGSDPFLKPMALVMAWGLLFGTGLTLVLIPSTYVSLQLARLKLSKWFSSKTPTEET